MMAEDKKMISASAEGYEADTSATAAEDISDKLKAAAGNINRVNADAEARKAAKEQLQKQAAEEAKARREEAKKKRQEEEKQSKMVAEQKLAAFHYAENYRKKLLKDKEKMMSAAKLRELAARQEAEAAAREEKAKEISAVREREFEEAKKRSERATALLNRVTKCAVVDADGNVRMVNRAELATAEAEAPAAMPESAAPVAEPEKVIEAEAPSIEVNIDKKAPNFTTEPEIPVYLDEKSREEAAARRVEQFLEGEMMDTRDGKFILNVEDDTMKVELTEQDDPAIAPGVPRSPLDSLNAELYESAVRRAQMADILRDSTARERAEQERILGMERDLYGRQLDELRHHRDEMNDAYARRLDDLESEIAAYKKAIEDLTGIKVPSPVVEAEPEPEHVEEEPVEEDETPEYPPVLVKNSVVLEIKDMAAAVDSKKKLKKLLKKANKAIKSFYKSIKMKREGVLASTELSQARGVLALVQVYTDLLHVRCDTLSACVRMNAKKPARRYSNALYSEIDGYNNTIGIFAKCTGEDLTRMSAFLPEHLLAGTGSAVIPAHEDRMRYIELFANPPKNTGDPLTFVFPKLKEMANGATVSAVPVTLEEQRGENRVSIINPINGPISAESVYLTTVEGSKAYKKYVKSCNKMTKKLYKAIRKIEKAAKKRSLGKGEIINIFNIEKEILLVAYHRLRNSLAAGDMKAVITAKRYLIEKMREYNSRVGQCEGAVEIELTRFGTAVADSIIQSGRVPEVPKLATCTELFETVGTYTRLVGEVEDEEKSGYTFVFGDYPSNKKAQETAPVEGDDLGKSEPIDLDNPPIPEVPAAPAPEADSGKKNKKDKKKKKYMAASSSDAEYLIIPFDDEGKKSNKAAKGVNGSAGTDGNDNAPDIATVLAACGYGDAVSGVAAQKSENPQHYIDAVREANEQREQQILEFAQATKAMVVEREEEISQYEQRIAALEKARAEEAEKAAKAMEYAKSAAEYARQAARAAETAKAAEGAKFANNGVQIGVSGVIEPIRLIEKADEKQGQKTKPLTRKQYKEFLADCQEKISTAEREFKEIEKKKDKAVDDVKPKAVVACLMAMKKVIDCQCRCLIAYCDAFELNRAETVKKGILINIARYNSLVADYERMTGGKLTRASESIPSDIMAGREYQVLPKITYTRPPYSEEEVTVGDLFISEEAVAHKTKDYMLMNRKQLSVYLSRREREFYRRKRALVKAIDQKNYEIDQDRTLALVKCIVIQREVVNALCEDLLACCQVSAVTEVTKVKKKALKEIKEYNALLDELEALSGDILTPASPSVLTEIIEGGEFEPLPDISYEVGKNKVKPLNKVEAALAKGKEIYKREITKEGHIALGKLQSKIVAQSNKDLAVLSHCAAFEVSLLESERDIIRYTPYGETPKIGKQRKQIAKKISNIKRRHRLAVKCASEDNKRYYELLVNNPATMETKKKNPSRKKIAALRSKMIALLNERDVINGQLTALYTGEEYNLDGTGVNQTWRKIKADAAEKDMKKQKELKRIIKKLPASPGEKEQLYMLLNKRIDAVSTISLCKHRIKKEHLKRGEKRRLKYDIKNSKRLIRAVDAELRERIQKINKRYDQSHAVSDWTLGMGLVLLLVILGVVAYFAIFNKELVDAIGWLFGK